MSLASILVNPHVLDEPPPNAKGAELQSIADLLRPFTRNPQLAQKVMEIVADEVHVGMRSFMVAKEEQLRFAFGKGKNLFAPFEAAIDTLSSDLQDDVLEAIPTILSLVRQLVDGLSSAGVQSFVGDLWDLVENDMGISADGLRQLVNDLFYRVINRLKQPFRDGDTSSEAIDQYDFGCSVDNLRDFLLHELEVPLITKELVQQMVAKIWRQYKIDENLQVVSQALAAGEQIIEPLAEIAQCIINQIEASSNGGNGSGESSDEPSFAGGGGWGELRPIGDESPDTSSDEDDNETMAWYASWVAGRNVKYSSDTTQAQNIYDNPELRGFTYKRVSRETIEQIAFHTAWIVPVLEAIPHAASAEKGDIWSNLTNIFANAIDAVLIGWPKFNLPKWAHWLGLPSYTLLAGLESHEGRWQGPWDDDPYIWTNILGDIGEAYMYRRISWTAREALLSILTLLNNDPEAASTWWDEAMDGDDLELEEIDEAWIKRNNNCFHGLAYLFGELLVMMVPGIISEVDKENYGFIDGGPGPQTWICGFIGAGVTWLMEYGFGAFIGRAMAGEWFQNDLSFALLPLRERAIKGFFFSDLWGEDAKGPDWLFSDFWRAVHNEEFQAGRDIFGGMAITILMLLGAGGRVVDSLLYLYLFTDGDTEDGTYCLHPNGDQYSYMGYPDKSTSPYLLPWESGTDKQCVQNNMGIWSHYPEDQQTYAYDFSHNMGDLVLCSRAGVVRAARDTVPNSTMGAGRGGWNFIDVIHVIIIPPGGTPPAGVTVATDVDSPYGGNRPFGDPAPTTPPAGGLQQYPGTTTDIPLNVVFPFYPDGSTPAYRESAAFPFGTSFAFIDPAHDRGIPGRTLPAGSTFTDGSAVASDDAFPPDFTGVPVKGSEFPAGTTFIPSATAGVTFDPLQVTIAVYGHGQQGFIGRVFATVLAGRTPDAGAGAAYGEADILGEFVQQGQAVMEADDTGVSAYNHLHTHIVGISEDSFTIPFVYRDEGQVKAMNFYTSTNTMVP